MNEVGWDMEDDRMIGFDGFLSKSGEENGVGFLGVGLVGGGCK